MYWFIFTFGFFRTSWFCLTGVKNRMPSYWAALVVTIMGQNIVLCVGNNAPSLVQMCRYVSQASVCVSYVVCHGRIPRNRLYIWKLYFGTYIWNIYFWNVYLKHIFLERISETYIFGTFILERIFWNVFLTLFGAHI